MSNIACIPKLSSDSIATERENVLTHMNFTNGYFAFTRTSDGSIPNRFYPTLEEAYRTTLVAFSKIPHITNSKYNYFSISDKAKKIIYRGNVKPSGKIKFTIYNRIEVNETSTISKELDILSSNNNSNKNNLINKEMKTESISIVSNELIGKPETNVIANKLSNNAQVYLDNNILTQSSLDFLCLPEDQAKSLAQNIRETAINNKTADNQTFVNAIADVSNGMITITKTLASGKPIVDTHVSFHDDSLYCAAHCKSADALWNGSNSWRKTPGKIAYDKISDVVMDMYHRGQQLLLESKAETRITTSKQLSTTTEKLSLNEVIANITSTVLTYLRCNSDMLHYLTIKGNTLEADLNQISNGVIAGGILNNIITLSIPSGHSCEISVSRFASDEQLRNAIKTNVAQLLVGASISDITRNNVSSLIDMSTIEEYYISSSKVFSNAA